jgi:hypothetical protein
MRLPRKTPAVSHPEETKGLTACRAKCGHGSWKARIARPNALSARLALTLTTTAKLAHFGSEAGLLTLPKGCAT